MVDVPILPSIATAAANAAAVACFAGVAVDPEALFKRHWTYVVIGGGAAGCVLARRLSEHDGCDVLLIEAGRAVDDPAVDAPSGWPSLAGGPFDWAYKSTVQAGLAGRSVPQPRGRGLGGSTIINALGYQRGPHAAYDRWAQEVGDPRWSFAEMLPCFRRMETASAGGDRWRGDSGPLHALHLGHVGDQNPLSVDLVAAGIEAGHPFNPDWNGASAEGTIWSQLTICEGRRDTAARAFLDPIRDRHNLGVLTSAVAVRLLLTGTQCNGVEVSLGGQTARIKASEVILAAGAFDSPKLLMLSGIGDPDALRRVGIAVTHPLPGVGRNLHDHPLMAGLLFQTKQPVPLSHYNHAESMIVTQSACARGWADLQIISLSVPYVLPHLGKAPEHGFSIVPANMDPLSRGHLTITSDDPRAPPLIDPAYLAEQADVDVLVEGVRIAREIAHSPALRGWVADEVFPGPSTKDRAALEAYVRNSVSPFYHPVSTCRMGRADDAMAVVDTDCRVHGLANLRIVDASIFPSIPQAMTNAAVIAVAERASDIILGRAVDAMSPSKSKEAHNVSEQAAD